jgi:hypothetical protein
MDHLPTIILEAQETLDQQDTRNILRGTVLDMTRTTRVEKEERVIEAGNKSRCLFALDLLTDRRTPPFSPLFSIPLSYRLYGPQPTSETRGAPPRALISHTCIVFFVSLNFVSGWRGLSPCSEAAL